MSAIALIPWARTDWTDSGRIAATAPLPLNAEGRTQAESWGRQLADRHLHCLYVSEELTSMETARQLADSAGSKIKKLGGLEEVSFGLWEGLTAETLKSRFPKVYKRWKEDPTSVCPPDGEEVTDALERIRTALRRMVRKAGDQPIGAVMGPFACAIARCEFERVPLSSMRDLLTTEPVWYDESQEGRESAVSSENHLLAEDPRLSGSE